MNNTRYHQQIVFGFAELFISICEKCAIQRVLNQSRLFGNICFPLKIFFLNHLQATVLILKISYQSGKTNRWRVESPIRKGYQWSYLIFIVIMTGSRLNQCLFTCPRPAFFRCCMVKDSRSSTICEGGRKLLWVLSQSRCKFNYCTLSFPSCLGVLGKQL